MPRLWQGFDMDCYRDPFPNSSTQHQVDNVPTHLVTKCCSKLTGAGRPLRITELPVFVSASGSLRWTNRLVRAARKATSLLGAQLLRDSCLIRRVFHTCGKTVSKRVPALEKSRSRADDCRSTFNAL